MGTKYVKGINVGSNPTPPTFLRLSYNGIILAFHARDKGSTPFNRSTLTFCIG